MISTVKNYRPARTKAKEIKISEFKKPNTILSKFKDLEEPYIKQKLCGIKSKPDSINDSMNN